KDVQQIGELLVQLDADLGDGGNPRSRISSSRARPVCIIFRYSFAADQTIVAPITNRAVTWKPLTRTLPRRSSLSLRPSFDISLLLGSNPARANGPSVFRLPVGDHSDCALGAIWRLRAVEVLADLQRRHCSNCSILVPSATQRPIEVDGGA